MHTRAALPLLAVLLASSGCGSSGSATPARDGSVGSPDASGTENYDTLKGTFTAQGIDATISGAVVGTYENPNGTYETAWNAVGSFVPSSSGIPTPATVTAKLASGETASVTISLSMIQAAPAAGTFKCDTGDYMLGVQFLVTKTGGAPVANYGGSGSSCTMTIDTPTKVSQGGLDVYFAHGSLTATLTETLPDGSQGTGTGTLSTTW